MIIRTRRKNESLIRRIFAKKTNNLRAVEDSILSGEQFRHELDREIFRADRRRTNREFGVVRLLGAHSQGELPGALLEAFMQRLRLSDSVGWYQSSLAFLLPETGQEGCFQVANALAEIARQHQWPVDTEVSIYPWDDDLVSRADEFGDGAPAVPTEPLAHPTSAATGTPPPNTGNSALTRRDDSSKLRDPHLKFAAANDRDLHGSSPANPQAATAVLEQIGEHAPIAVPMERLDAPATLLGPAVQRVAYRFVESHPTPRWKRVVDLICVSGGLAVLSPVLVGAAIAIKCTSKGPILFCQQREGKDGKPFGIYKFRTMVVDAEAKQMELRTEGQNEQDGPAFKLENDPRVTKVGRYLRKSCIDELPQMFNVLKGEMSFVGPRPLPVEESTACLGWQRSRLTVLPGITCIWQVSGGRHVKFAQWMRMDLDYIEKQSFWFDAQLIVKTALKAILHRGSV